MQQPGGNGMAPEELQDDNWQQNDPGEAQDKRTLWIGSLDEWMDENYLNECFANTNGFVRAKVIRNKQTNESEGYGFLFFSTRALARCTMQTTNGQKMPGSKRTFKINWGFGATDKRAEHSLFVGDLSNRATDDDLLETFKNKYHSVLRARVVTDNVTGRSKKYGFVYFGDEGEQQKALTEMDGVLCTTRRIRVGPAAKTKLTCRTLSAFTERGLAAPALGPAQTPQHVAAPANAAPVQEVRSLWIGNLRWWMDESYLTSCFNSTKEFVSAKVIRNKLTSKSEGYGFLEYKSRAAARSVLQSHNGETMPDSEQSFQLRWASGASEKRTENSPEHKIYVENLSGDVTKYVLHETFKNVYQSVKEAYVVTDKVTGRPKGYGFVCFGDEGEQKRAMKEMDGAVCLTRKMRVRPAANKKPVSAAPNPTKLAFPVRIMPQPGGPALPLERLSLPPLRGSRWWNLVHRLNEVHCIGAHDGFLWIMDLPSWVDKDYLTNCFINNGDLISVDVYRDKLPNRVVVYGLLGFSSQAAAESVLQSHNHAIMPHEVIFHMTLASLDEDEDERPYSGFDYKWIGNLQEWVDEVYLTICFEDYELVCAKVFRNNSERYGLLGFSSRHAATAASSFPLSQHASDERFLLFWAHAGDDEHEISFLMEEAKKKLEAEESTYQNFLPATYQSLPKKRQGESDPNNTTIFVGNLDPSVTEDVLKGSFSPFAERDDIVHVKIQVGKRCGFVQFADRFHAEVAFSLNGDSLGGQNIRVSWALSPLSEQMD